MRRLFDTSALVAGLVNTNPDHPWAAARLTPVLRGERSGALSTHTLAETYAVLTASPTIRMAPPLALDVIARLRRSLRVVSLGEDDYAAALSRLAGLGIQGGAIYDALHAQAALKVGAERLVTLNAKHFVRLGPDVASIVESP